MGTPLTPEYIPYTYMEPFGIFSRGLGFTVSVLRLRGGEGGGFRLRTLIFRFKVQCSGPAVPKPYSCRKIGG